MEISIKKIWQNNPQITPSFKGRGSILTENKDAFIKTEKHRKQRLNKESMESKFFGVDSPRNILNSLRHQELLNRANRAWEASGKKGKIVSSKRVYSINNTDEIINSLNEKQNTGISFIEELKKEGAGKITFRDEIFGKNILGGTHTIGFVYNDNRLYILDSLGEDTKKQKIFHTKLKEIFYRSGFENIIFSTKDQQSYDEYTCNNWTFANIKSTLTAIHGRKEIIKTSRDLDKILEDDINKILNEQYKCVTSKMG